MRRRVLQACRRQPLALAEIFYLQDFSPSSPWRDWIEAQYESAIASLGFDGIHIDQYGFPKRALSRASGTWRELDIGAEFPGFVEEACRRILARRPDGGSIFNCVNAWPLDAMPAVASDAATYIEVWEPHSSYRDLYDLVRRARTLRPDKAVILAAYLLPFSPDRPRTAGAMTTFRLTSAAIGASGGFHLIAGEGNALLTEAYYPRYGRLGPVEMEVVRSYADFGVRNTTRLHDVGATDIAWTHVGPTNDLITLDHPSLGFYGAGAVPDSLWVVGREVGLTTVLHLVNLRGLVSDAWNVEQPSGPSPIDEITLRVRVTGAVRGVWWDTPDDREGTARALPYDIVETSEGRFLVVRLPRIEVWSMVWWELEAFGRGVVR
jgi:dextranase